MLRNLALLGFTSLLGLMMVEAFLYVMPQYQAGEPQPEFVFCQGVESTSRPSERFGRTEIPNSAYFRRESEADDWYLRAYNGEGFRDLLNTGSDNVIILGDSFIEGELVSNDQTIPYLLDLWNPDLAFRAYALGGWGTSDEYRAYRAIDKKIDHRLVVLGYFVGNDLADNNRATHAMQVKALPASAGDADQEDEGSLLFKLHVQLRAHSRAYTFFYVNGRRLALDLLGKDFQEDGYLSPAEVEHGADVTETMLSDLSRATSANGADLLIVVIPSWNEMIGVKGEKRVVAKQRQMIRSVADASDHVRVLDLKPIVETAGHERVYGRVDKHFNQLGYYLAAKAIHEWINGTWRTVPVVMPEFAWQDRNGVRPDCAAIPRYVEALSNPERPALTSGPADSHHHPASSHRHVADGRNLQ